jgi:hypothetical protein
VISSLLLRRRWIDPLMTLSFEERGGLFVTAYTVSGFFGGDFLTLDFYPNWIDRWVCILTRSPPPLVSSESTDASQHIDGAPLFRERRECKSKSSDHCRSRRVVGARATTCHLLENSPQQHHIYVPRCSCRHYQSILARVKRSDAWFMDVRTHMHAPLR